MTVVKPLYKKSVKTSVTKYRPSSLFTFTEVLEKVIYSRLSRHMHTNSVLVPEQFGLRKGACWRNFL
jgi:hypothetical protein